jgi:hypothetical protein
MKIEAGPEINFSTWCCDLKQKVQYRVFVGSEPPAVGAVAASCLAASDISTSTHSVRKNLTVR